MKLRCVKFGLLTLHPEIHIFLLSNMVTHIFKTIYDLGGNADGVDNSLYLTILLQTSSNPSSWCPTMVAQLLRVGKGQILLFTVEYTAGFS